MKSTLPGESQGYSGLVRSLLLVVAAGLCTFVTVGCGGGGGDGNAAQNPTTAPAEPTSTTPVRKRAPAIAGTSLDGEPVSLADYRGQAVLVNVWSSW
jgi:hypothetical protein